MINIRKRQATLLDEQFMRALHKAAYHDVVVRQFGSWDDQLQYSLFTQKWIPENFEIIEIDEKPIGCISIANHPDEVFIAELQILPEFQSRGIGGKLIQVEIILARRMQKTIRLQVLHKNEKARVFYERLGFVINGTTDRHFNMSIFQKP